MASSSSTSKPDDQQHYRDKEAGQKNQNGESSSKQMKYIAIVVLVIIVVMSAAMGTIWAVVKPKRPVYAIEYGVITNAIIPEDNPYYLSGNFSFVMRSYNPNKEATIYYESMNISTSFSENKSASPIWYAENFSQPPFNVTRIPFTYFATFSSDKGNIWGYLQHGRITANISVKAKMRFKYRNWKSMPHPIGIFCQPAAVMLGHNFQTTDCYVDL